MTFQGNIYDGPHTDIVGTTGSGKSSLAKHLYRECPGFGIYVNTGAEADVAGHTVDIERGDKWDISLLNDYRRINLIPVGEPEKDLELLSQVQSDLFALGSNIGHENGRFYVFVDEAHEYAGLSAAGDNPVVRMAKRGRRHNVRLFPISQAPADLSKAVVRECNYHVIFAIGTYSENYFKNYGMPADEIRETVGHKDAHKFVIYDDFEVHGAYRLKAAEA